MEYPFTIHRGEHFVKEEQSMYNHCIFSNDFFCLTLSYKNVGQNLIPFVKEIMVEASKTIDLKESTNLSFYRNSHDSYN